MRDSCPHCGSNRILPLVFGSPSDAMMQLSVQNLILLGGCTGIGPGSSLWECDDCRRSLTDPNHMYSDDPSSEAMKRYHSTLERIFASRRPLSDNEYEILRGRMTLKSHIVQAFRRHCASAAVIVQTESGYEVHVDRDGQTHIVQYYLYTTNQFQRMSRFVHHELANSGEVRMTVRVGNEDGSFIITSEPRDADTIIRVRVG